jgi:tRNA pseudouridine38-40 synthase
LVVFRAWDIRQRLHSVFDMGRWKLTIEFEGTGFSGWQKQKQERTVQGELEKALSTFTGMEIEVMGQGRTDSGVHAESQIAHSDLPDTVDPEKVLYAMYGLLPRDMAVIGIEKVKSDFHARFHATSRSYRYQIADRPVPLNRHTHWLIMQSFNERFFHECAEMIKGDHDFVNFSKIDPDKNEFGTTICNILVSEWMRSDTGWKYKIKGDRFLRHMVRRLVGTMVLVATGKMEKNQFEDLLSGKKSARKGHAAPACGLILENVEY